MYEDLVKYLKEELAREPEERQDATNQLFEILEGVAQYQPVFENGLNALAKGVERIWAQAEPGLNEVADMAVALMKAAKDFEDSGALAPLDDLIRKTHECFTTPLDAFGGLSPCEALSAFQKRAEGELEKIIAMLSAYYSLASPSPVGNMETAAITPAAGAVGQNRLLSPGGKHACPHASQGIFPHYCDAHGRCHLDFSPEYRHSDIHIEGDPAMKNSLPALCFACLLLAMPACNDNSVKYANPEDAYAAFLEGKLSATEFIELWNPDTEKIAADTPIVLDFMYTSRSAAFLFEKDYDRAEEEARKAIALDYEGGRSGWSALGDVFAASGRWAEAADAFERSLNCPGDQPTNLDKARETIAKFREGAKVITPEDLDATAVTDEQAGKTHVKRLVTLQGEIKAVELTSEEPVLEFAGSKLERNVTCRFYPNMREKCSGLKPGQTVTVAGVFEGSAQNGLSIEFCRLLSVNP